MQGVYPVNGPEMVYGEGDGMGQACNGSSCQKSVRVEVFPGGSVKRA